MKIFKTMERTKTGIKIQVRNGRKSINVEIPWSERTASLEVRTGTTPAGVLDMIDNMVDQMNKMK